MRYLFGVIYAVTLGVTPIVGCSGGGQSGGPSDGILEGDPSDLAASVVSDYYSGDVTAESEISLDANGALVDRTHVEIAFVKEATVGELNAVLASVDASIVSMLEGVNIILVRIPDPSELRSLDELILKLESDRIVRYVTRSYMPEPAALPANYSFASSDEDKKKIDHHLAVRAHAAWNAENALRDPFADPPLMIVADYFGGGGLNGDFNVNSDPTDFEGGNPDSQGHGYHVLGIISATHGGGSSNRGLATGMYPGTLDLKVFDFVGGLNVAATNHLMLMEIKKSNKNVIVNTSFTYGPKSCSELLVSCMESRAISWIEEVRGALLYATGKTGPASLENSFLHFSAAGNIVDPGDASDATTASGYNAARLLTGLQTKIGVSLDNLNNTLVIENRTNGTTEPYAAGCLNITTGEASRYPGDLSAIGTEVWSLTGNQTGAESLTGTSMATPQAAGLAAYVWALAPGLSPQELLNLLRETSDDELFCASPVVDAYSAVLAVDKASVLEGASLDEAPVRMAILDIVADDEDTLGSNEAFDEKDLGRFLQELHTFDPPRIDYSRFDLNGDGYTGGKERRTRFNLDIDYPPNYRRVSQDIDGAGASFDEHAVSDMEVLCYYAYSPLYTGDKDLRGQLLADYGDECPVSRIAYIGNAAHWLDPMKLYTMKSDGTDVRRISNVSEAVQEFRWSPDGKKIAFTSYVKDDTAPGTHIFIVDADGSNQVDLSVLIGMTQASDDSPTWSPDSKRLAFSSTRNSDTWNIFVANIDGTGLKPLTQEGIGRQPGERQCGAWHEYPMWAPVGEKIAFRSTKETVWDDLLGCGFNEPQIYTINADGTGLVQRTNVANDYPNYTEVPFQEDWSPDGETILYNRSSTEYEVLSDGTVGVKRGGFAAYTNLCVNTSGQDSCLTSVTEDNTHAGSGRWSPDGSKIAYSYGWYEYNSVLNGPILRGEIHVLSLDDRSDKVLVTTDASPPFWRYTSETSWSSDSRRLVFSGYPKGDSQYGTNVFMLNADGTGRMTEVTALSSPANENGPQWQP